MFKIVNNFREITPQLIDEINHIGANQKLTLVNLSFDQDHLKHHNDLLINKKLNQNIAYINLFNQILNHSKDTHLNKNHQIKNEIIRTDKKTNINYWGLPQLIKQHHETQNIENTAKRPNALIQTLSNNTTQKVQILTENTSLNSSKINMYYTPQGNLIRQDNICIANQNIISSYYFAADGELRIIEEYTASLSKNEIAHIIYLSQQKPSQIFFSRMQMFEEVLENNQSKVPM